MHLLKRGAAVLTVLNVYGHSLSRLINGCSSAWGAVWTFQALIDGFLQGRMRFITSLCGVLCLASSIYAESPRIAISRTATQIKVDA